VVNLQRFKLERIKLAVFKKLYCHGTMPGGGRKKRLCPETTASGVATRAEVLNTMPTSATTDNVPPMCQRAAKFMREVTEATNCFEDEVGAESRALRADNATLRADNAAFRMKNAALIVRMQVATKTVKRSKALAGKYYDLCVTSGVDAEVLDAVEEAEEPDKEAEEPDKEAEEPDKEAEEPDKEAVFAIALFNFERVEEQQHVPP
jgi:hypothetical protein